MLLAAMVLTAVTHGARAAEQLTVGVLKFGTVNWQLNTLKDQALDKAENIDLQILPLASKNATSIALQAGEADVIVTDWIWAQRQRAEGEDFVFVPYTRALGALVVARGSAVTDIAGLKGKRIGIVGGPLDKSWLIMRTWTRRTLGYDLAEHAEEVFAAPPLLSEQMRQGRLDAVLTFWPYAARLGADGFTTLVSVADVLGKLGVESAPPLVGYVFRKGAAEKRPQAFRGLFRAIARTNAHLARSDTAWDKVRPLMKAADDTEFAALKAGYRKGIPGADAGGDLEGARKLFQIMKDLGGEKLLGRAERFEPELFWAPGGQ
ncbi:MAG: ABC transporter substrate-binding protein [Hyphomicrobiales bacterium]